MTTKSAVNVKQDNVLGWFWWLTRWVRQTFWGRQVNRKPLKILERTYSSDELTTLLSVERDAPGAIATWYLFDRRHPRNYLLITLDNLAAVRLALRKNRPPGNAISDFELSLIHYDMVIRTHRLSIQWIIKLNSSRTVLHVIGAWDADLQGDSLDPNANAITILRLIVREALNLQPIPGVLWRSRMTEFPWSESVQSYACSVLGEKHNCHLAPLHLTSLMRIK